jgi:hypothetical protein
MSISLNVIESAKRRTQRRVSPCAVSGVRQVWFFSGRNQKEKAAAQRSNPVIPAYAGIHAELEIHAQFGFNVLYLKVRLIIPL